jgi:hypothetical protein
MLQANGHVRTVSNRRGPRWAIASRIEELVPELHQITNDTASNWLSRQAISKHVERRQYLAPYKKLPGFGRPPKWEYRVADVRRRVKQLLDRR